MKGGIDMLYKLIIHLSIILSLTLFSYDFSFFGLKVESYQTFLILFCMFHFFIKINYVSSDKKFIKNGIILQVRY